MDKKSNKRLSNGSYSIAVAVIAMAVLVILNLIFAKLPSTVTQFDFSTTKLYTLTETTKQYLDSLTEDITIYYICEGGQEDDTTDKLLERYEDASDRIRVEQIDPVLYPGFTSQYTDEKLENNSLIVVSDRLTRVVHGEDLYIQDYSSQTGGYVNVAFDGEGRLTSAIDYVLSDDIPVFYVLNGNGEMGLGDSYVNAIEKNNIVLKDLNLLSEERIPEDAAAVIIAAPAKDYTQAETEAILDYLEKGGRAMIFSGYTTEPMPNLSSILTNYGMDVMDGIILEGDSSYYMTYQYCLLPQISYTEITKDLYGKTYLLMPMTQAIREAEVHRDSISFQPILSSSVGSYNKADVQNMTTAEKEAGDQEGPFIVGLLAEEDINQDHVYDTRVVFYSTGYLLDEDYNQNVSGANAELVSGTAAYLRNSGQEMLTSVPAKSLQVQYLTMTSFKANLWTVLSVFAIPAAFLAAGMTIWFMRRKK